MTGVKAMRKYTTMDSVDDIYIRDSPGAPIDDQVKNLTSFFLWNVRCIDENRIVTNSNENMEIPLFYFQFFTGN